MGRIVPQIPPSRLQPLRKLAHAAFGVLVAGVLARAGMSYATAVALITGMLAVAVAIEALRLTDSRTNETFYRVFGHLVRPTEKNRIVSSTWYTLGLLLTVALFPRPAAVSAILVLALADPAAAWIGSRWGRLPFLGGTVEGSLAFAAVALAILAYRHDPGVAALAVIACVLAERAPLDDNLAVPLTAAGTITLLG